MMSMFLIVFVLFGWLAYRGMSLELTPEVSMPMIAVQTIYPGASPKEIETQITKKIEDAVSPVSEIDYIQSYSMENVSYVLVVFEMTKDANLARQEVKDKVDAILNDLPGDADIPVVQRYDPTEVPVMELILSGPASGAELYEFADKHLKNRFAQINGVATVGVTGGQEREIRVEMDSKTVLQQSASLQQVAGVLAAQNMDIPGGNFQRNEREYSVRMKGEFPDVESIRNLEIPTAGGLTRLGDVANITDMGAEVRERTTFFDRISNRKNDNVVQISIKKSSGGNPVRIYDAVNDFLPEIQKTLPEGCRLDVVNESATFTRDSVSDTINNIIMGVILTGLILLFFLHDYKSTIIVALSMPMSIVSTFLLMKMSGFTLNIMSLMGLSTAVGVLVTNSIVVLENIFRHKDMGHGRIESASKGTSEIAVAVLASTLTNLVVFLPLGTMSSIAGRFFQQFSLTVVYATIFSLIMSFTLTPMLAARILPEHDRKKHPVGEWLERMFHSWDRAYGRSLEWLFRSRLRSGALIVATVALLAGSLVLAAHTGFDFIPAMDEGRLAVKVEMPVGTSLEETGRVMETVQNRLKKYGQVSYTWTTLGNQGETSVGVNLAMMNLKLVSADERENSSREMAGIITKELSDIPNARIRVSSVLSLLSGRADLEFYLTGNDQDSLAVYSARLASRFKDIPGVINLNTSMRSGKPEITITPDRDELMRAGLTAAELAVAIRGAVDGIVATRYKEGGEEYDIRLQLTRDTVDSPEEIGDIPVAGKSGTYRVSQLADVAFTEGYDRILHHNRTKVVMFEADIAEGYSMSDLEKEITRITNEAKLPSGYEIVWGVMAEQLGKTTDDMVKAFTIAVILTYMLLAAMLESLYQPLLILGTIPLALIGVFGSLSVTGLSMNIISMLSIVMLVGIVVNNAILQLDYTNTLVREQGRSVTEALLEACPTKLKPILMSNIAIIVSMMPMALGFGSSGKELRQPMGVVSIGGLVVSTLLSLYLIPVLYNLISGKKRVNA